MTANRPDLSREVRAGALAALQAIQKAETLAGEYESTSDMEETPWKALHGGIDHRQRVVANFLEAAGELPPYAQGFVATLAEYIDFGMRIGEPDLANWKPEAVMTAEEIEKSRAEALADMLRL